MTSRWHSRGAEAEVEAVIGARTRLVNTIYTRFPQRSLRHPTVRGGTERVHHRTWSNSYFKEDRTTYLKRKKKKVMKNEE